MASKTVAADHISPADLTPQQRASYERIKAKALADRHLEGPPLPPIDYSDGAPFYFELRSFVKQLKDAREAAELMLAQVAAKTGLAEETLCRLESGAVTNPTWKTLGLYAAAVECGIALAAEPLKKRKRK